MQSSTGVSGQIDDRILGKEEQAFLMKAYKKCDRLVELALYSPLAFLIFYSSVIEAPILGSITSDIACVLALGTACSAAILPLVRWRFSGAASQIGIPGTIAIRFARTLAKQEPRPTIRGLVMAFPILFDD